MTFLETSSIRSGIFSFCLSILFWSGLGLVAVLMATLVNSPRYLQFEQLRHRFAENAQTLLDLQRESRHLTQLATALKTDPEFLRLVAASELGTVPPGSVRIPFSSDLQQESRLLPSGNTVVEKTELLPYFPLLETIATSADLRLRLGIAIAILTLLVFTCCNESFFRGGLHEMGARLTHPLGQRYVASPTVPAAEKQ